MPSPWQRIVISMTIGRVIRIDFLICRFFFFQAEDGIRDLTVTGVQTCALPISFATLADWRYELGFDTHSLSTDPRFVDVDGADGIRGFQEFGGLRFEGFANRTFTGTATVTAIDRVVSFPSIFGGFRGLPDNN